MQERREPPTHAGDDAERALRSDEQVRQVVAGIVLRESGEAGDDRAVGEHRLKPGHVRPRRAVAQRAGTAGVAGDDAPDRARVSRREVEPGILVGGASGCVQRGEGDAGTDGDLAERAVDLADRGEAGERDDNLMIPGNAAPDETRVPALGHDRDVGAGTRGHHRRHLIGVRRSDDEPRPAAVAAGVVTLVSGAQVRIGEHVARAHSIR